MDLSSLQKTCLGRLIWPQCFKYSWVFCFLLGLTSNKDVSTILFIIFSHSYTDRVEAFIFFVEMRKCQCCPISTPMCLYPFWWRNRYSWVGERVIKLTIFFSITPFFLSPLHSTPALPHSLALILPPSVPHLLLLFLSLYSSPSILTVFRLEEGSRALSHSAMFILVKILDQKWGDQCQIICRAQC